MSHNSGRLLVRVDQLWSPWGPELAVRRWPPPQPAGSSANSASFPSVLRQHGAAALPPASAPIYHPGRHPPLAFVAALPASVFPEGCWSLRSASAPAAAHSNAAFPRLLQRRSPRPAPASSPSASPPPAAPSPLPPARLPVHGWPSASSPLPSPCRS